MKNNGDKDNKNNNIKSDDHAEDVVDEASEESFPASDPPSFIYREPKKKN